MAQHHSVQKSLLSIIYLPSYHVYVVILGDILIKKDLIKACFQKKYIRFGTE